MPTAQTLIEDAYRKVGVGAEGEPFTAIQLSDGLREFNRMLDAWRAETLTIPQFTREVFPLVANQMTYTIGPSGNFARSFQPLDITGAALLLAPGPQENEIPLDVLTDQQWASIQVKRLPSTLPTAVAFTRGPALGTIDLWPIPTTAVNSLVLYLETPLDGYASLSTNLSLPSGYEDAYVYNLADRFAIEFARPDDSVAARVSARAIESLARIKRTNVELVELQLDPGLVGGGYYNILTDGPR